MHPVAGFLYGGVRKTDYVKAGKGIGKIHFHSDLVCVYAQNAHSGAGTKHAEPLPCFCLYLINLLYNILQ